MFELPSPAREFIIYKNTNLTRGQEKSTIYRI